VIDAKLTHLAQKSHLDSRKRTIPTLNNTEQIYPRPDKHTRLPETVAALRAIKAASALYRRASRDPGRTGHQNQRCLGKRCMSAPFKPPSAR